jgi:hypothetical protein
MAAEATVELLMDHQFDPVTCRHTLNGRNVVLHCHHYASLMTQLANDLGMLDGKALLAAVAEDTFHGMLRDYFAAHCAELLPERIDLAEQYYAAMGLGRMAVVCAGTDAGRVELLHSHVDEGWVKKWGQREEPVNHITRGYVAALFAVLFGRAPRSYSVVETQSIVSGAAVSRFNVVAN